MSTRHFRRGAPVSPRECFDASCNLGGLRKRCALPNTETALLRSQYPTVSVNKLYAGTGACARVAKAFFAGN